MDVAGKQTGNDELSKFVVALGIRVTASLSADYLFRALEEHPAAPTELAAPLRDLAGAYQDLLLLQIADAPSADLEYYYQQIDELDPKVVEACK